MAPTVIDHLLVLFFAVLLPVRGAFVSYPRFRASAAGAHSRMRVRFYRQSMFLHLALAAAAVIAWSLADRTWTALGLGVPDPALLAVGLAAALVGLLMHYLQGAQALRRPELRARSAAKLGRLQPLLPRSQREFEAFAALGMMAGFAEELLFRGFLPAYLNAYVPLGVAATVSVLLFGLGHLYQGMKGVLQTTAIGAVLMLLYLATGSLWPGVVFHAGFNLISGFFGYALLRSDDPPRDA